MSLGRFIIVAALAFWIAGQAQAASEPNNVDRAFVQAAQKRGAILWDVRDRAEYLNGHIPGAVNVGDVARTLRDPNREDFIPTAALERILGAAGIDPAREIVVYGSTGNPYVAYAQYAIRYIGGRKAYIYHAGIEDWAAGGGQVSKTPPAPMSVKLSIKADTSQFVTTDEMTKAVGRADVQIVDARTPKEFSGDDIRAIRGGHIPGAVNVPYEQNWKDPETPQKLAQKQVKDRSGMDLKDRDALKALYANLDPKKETVVYCQSGVRAAQTAAVLEDLGFEKVKVYESSWLGYAAKLSAPVDNETFFNVGALNGQLAGMQRRIDQLEADLAAARQQGAPAAK
jgi:thiosulfate/3-mercaptopyruvate sulfurtransferase